MIRIYECIQSLPFRLTRCNVALDLVSISVVVFLDALASLDLKLSVSQSLMFFGLPVNQVNQVIQVK